MLLRAWQKACLKRFRECIGSGRKRFVLEACMGSGKSVVAAEMSKELLGNLVYNVEHVLVLVPGTSIQGDTVKGMLGTFGTMGLDPRERFFT